MKIIKQIFIFFLIIFSILTTFSYVSADEPNLLLNSLNFDVKINTDGSMDIEEIWNIKYINTGTIFKTFEKNKTRYSEIINGRVSSILSSGKEYEFEQINQYQYRVPIGQYYLLDRGNEHEIAWGVEKSSVSNVSTYKVSYTVTDAIAKYNDCSEMYWQFIGKNFEIPINKINGKITLPNSATNKEDIKVWGHTPDLNGTINVTSNNTIEFELNDNKANKMVEVRIAMPSDIIYYSGRTYSENKLDNIIAEETTWANQANKTRSMKIIAVYSIIGIVLFIIARSIYKNIKILKNTKEVIPTQEFDYFRDIPRQDATPAEAIFIIENSYNEINQISIGRVFSSTLLNLSLKKLIKFEKIIDEKGREDTEIQLLYSDIFNITNNKDELQVFDFLKKACKNKEISFWGTSKLDPNSITITVKQLKRYIEVSNTHVIKLKKDLDKSLKEKLLQNQILDKEGIKKKSKVLSGASGISIIFTFFYIFLIMPNFFITILSLMSIPSYIYFILGALVIFTIILRVKVHKKISAYTQKGVDEQEKWKALKKYMEDFSLLNEKDIPDLKIWERYLVYATAFGISEKVIKQLKMIYPNINDFDYSIYPSMYIMMNTDFSSSFNSISSSMSSSFSSGSGGGGGFSGGGGGGGGRWRRPVAVNM